MTIDEKVAKLHELVDYWRHLVGDDMPDLSFRVQLADGSTIAIEPNKNEDDNDRPYMDDLAQVEVAEVQIDPFSTRLWINIEGRCRLRIQRIDTLVLDDQRLTVENIALAIRRDRFERSAPHGTEPDPEVPFSDQELADAAAAVKAMRNWQPAQ